MTKEINQPPIYNGKEKAIIFISFLSGATSSFGLGLGVEKLADILIQPARLHPNTPWGIAALTVGPLTLGGLKLGECLARRLSPGQLQEPPSVA